MNANEIESKNGTLSINKQTVIQRKNTEQRNIFNEAEATLGVAKNRLGPAGMFSQSPIGNISGYDFYEVSNERYTSAIRQNTSLMSEKVSVSDELSNAISVGLARRDDPDYSGPLVDQEDIDEFNKIIAANMDLPLGASSVYETYKKATDNSYADTLRFEEFSSIASDNINLDEEYLTEEEIANNSDGFGFKQGSVELSELSLNYRHKNNPFRDGNYKALTDGKLNNFFDDDFRVVYNGYPLAKPLDIHTLSPTWPNLRQIVRPLKSIEKNPQNNIGSTPDSYREQVYNSNITGRFGTHLTQGVPGLGYYTTEGGGTHATKVENLSSTDKIRLGDYFTRKYN
jgi:hypothetical protein